MGSVLVTGGTGTLGSRLVPRLLERGDAVRVLSRKANPTIPEGATAATGDVLTGAGLTVAVEGVDTVVHAATSPRRRVRKTEVEGTRHVAAVSAAAGAHLVYVSIVGVDDHRLPYYKAKWEAEQVVQASGGQWSILRATQFHDLMDGFLSGRVFPAPRRTPFQPVDAGEVSDALVDVIEAGPSGRAPDVGGPELLTIGEMKRMRKEITGHRGAMLVPVPAIGFVRDLVDGKHTCPDRKVGRITWAEWLRAQRARG